MRLELCRAHNGMAFTIWWRGDRSTGPSLTFRCYWQRRSHHTFKFYDMHWRIKPWDIGVVVNWG